MIDSTALSCGVGGCAPCSSSFSELFASDWRQILKLKSVLFAATVLAAGVVIHGQGGPSAPSTSMLPLLAVNV